MKRTLACALALVVGLPVTWAVADFAGTAGSGLTFFSFTCFTSKICTAQVPVTSAGAEILPATSTLQTTANTKLDTINTTLGTPLQAGGAVTATLGAETTKVIGTVRVASGGVASGSFASGSIASGAVASGAFASGALASGSIASGAMVDLLTFQGTKAAGTAAANSLLGGCVYNSGGVTLTTGQQAACQFTSAGSIHMTADNTNANGQASAANSSPVVGATGTIGGGSTGTAGTAATNVVTVQGISSMTKLLVTPDSVALPANQSVNVSQINGVTPLMGSGATGTGSPRMTLATDSPGIVTLGQTTKSASVPVTIASDQYLDVCANPAIAKVSVPIGITSAATTALVATSASTVIYGCGFVFSISQVVTTANTLKFVTGTGATCGTGQSDLTGLFGGGGVTAAAPIVIKQGMGSTIFKTAAGGALCATTAIGASASFQGILTYVQQ